MIIEIGHAIIFQSPQLGIDDVKTFKTGKRENKLKLQKMLGLNEDKDVMLIGMVSRLSVQKGFDLITYMAEEFLTGDYVKVFDMLNMNKKEFFHSTDVINNYQFLLQM